jgi:hypothetical protein
MMKKLSVAIAALLVAAGLAFAAPAHAGGPTPPTPLGGWNTAKLVQTPIHRDAPKVSAVPGKKGSFGTFTFNPTRYYAGGQDTPAVSKTAFAGNMTVYDPPTVDTGDQSLMEMTVQASGAGYSPQYGQAIIGIGWRKYNGSLTLFAERFRNGVWGGSFVGSGDGWVDYSGTGAGLDLGSTLSGTGAGKSFQWIYDSASGGRWWGYYDGKALGYYPLSIWSTGTSPTYTFNGLQFGQAYVEVYDDDTSVSPCTDAGNGVLATGSGSRANFTSLRYATGDYANMGSWPVVTNSSWYNTLPVNVVSHGGGADAYVGGPGAC